MSTDVMTSSSASSSEEMPVKPLYQVLHVGCGQNIPDRLYEPFRDGLWQEIRLDLNPDVEPDIVADIRTLAPVPSDSVDAVFSSHNIEHLHSWEIPQALKTFHRVLRPHGILIITMPNMQAVAEQVAKGNIDQPLYTSPAGPITALDIMYGHQPHLQAGNHYMAHKSGFTPDSLRRQLTEAGFEAMTIFGIRYDLWAYAHKTADDIGFNLTPPEHAKIFPETD